MVLDSAHHALRIRRLVAKGMLPTADVSEVVLNSWKRCMEDYGLKPESTQLPPVLTRAEFLERHECSGKLLYEAGPEMELLYHQLGDSQLVVVLVDRDGTILHLVESPDLQEELAALNLRRGAVWSERYAGSNGIGTCLHTTAPTLIQTTDHFFHKHTLLTCAAVPIYDPRGELIAALNVTGTSGSMPNSSMALINLAARMVENRLMDAACADALSIYFHVQPERANTVYGGRLMLSPENGTIVAANRNALLLLGIQHASELHGRSIESVFQLPFHTLLQKSIEHSFQPMPVFSSGVGNRFFAVAQYSQKKLSYLLASGEHVELLKLPVAAEQATEIIHNDAKPKPTVTEFGDSEIDASFEQALKVAKFHVPILIQGEVGTGKEHFAKAFHQEGERQSHAFVSLDCMALAQDQSDETLIAESRTTTEQLLASKIAQAKNGVLFIDKVEELSLSAQGQLLRALDEHEGLGPEQQPLLITASTGRLLDRVQQGHFRADLYYRISGFELNLKPLRERSQKAQLFRAMLNHEGYQGSISEAAEKQLLAYQWPGNVRQLAYVLKVMLAQADNKDILDEQHVPVYLFLRESAVSPSLSLDTPAPLKEVALRSSPIELSASQPEETVEGLNPLEQTERLTLLRLLEDSRWNISSVSKQLGMSRNTLYRRLHRLQIPLRSE